MQRPLQAEEIASSGDTFGGKYRTQLVRKRTYTDLRYMKFFGPIGAWSSSNLAEVPSSRALLLEPPGSTTRFFRRKSVSPL